MAFPSITPLRVSTFEQRPTAQTFLTANGTPVVLQTATGRKFNIEAVYLLTTANVDLLIADYEANHSTSFSWTDDRDSTSRTVYYNGRPSVSRIHDGTKLTSAHRSVVVRLIEV